MDQLSSAAIAAMAAKRRRAPAQRPPFECIALLLQGGGALGSYQAGVYSALAEAKLQPDWVAGICRQRRADRRQCPRTARRVGPAKGSRATARER
jgi:hypothetical protein